MNYRDFEISLGEMLPNADICVDNNGQLVVYTGCMLEPGTLPDCDKLLVPFVDCTEAAPDA